MNHLNKSHKKNNSLNAKQSLKKNLSNSLRKKKSIIRNYAKSLRRSLTKKYSSKKTSVSKLLNTREFIDKRIETNSKLISDYQQKQNKKSLKNKMFEISTNPQLMESLFFMVKVITCGLIIPLLMFKKGGIHEINYFYFIEAQSKIMSEVIVTFSKEHPVASVYLVE